MLCGCRGDRWPIQCLMAAEVEKGFYNAGLFCSLLANLIALSILTMLVWALRMVMMWWEVFNEFII